MKKLLLSALSLFACVLAMGEPVSSKQALEIAANYLAKSGAPRRAAAQMSVQPFQTDRQGNPLMYAVNNGGDGYVIVSGDDRMRQVLAYSNSGSLDLADMPANMRYWLEGLCADMQLLIDAGYQPQAVDNRRAASDVKPEIKVMLSSLWTQGSPYNDLCPLDGTNRALTGCVATAIAQVLNYHKKVRKADIPSTPLQDTKAYKGNRGIIVPALKASHYTIDWNELIDDYTAEGVTPTKAQKDNIAKLMYFCGAAVLMDYKSSVSLAEFTSIAPMLINYFGFSRATRLVYRMSYTEQQWNDLIYNELKNGRPVLYGGSGTGGGHHFVVDGYNGNEMFHVNWGWKGNFNSYVALSVLNSEKDFPIGARESTAEFAAFQNAVINAEYGGTAQTAECLSFFKSYVDGYTIEFALINQTGVKNTFEVCLAVKDLETGKIDYIDGEKDISTWEMGNGYYKPYTYNFTSPYKPSANKKMMIYPVSRVKGTTEWLPISNPVLEYALASYDADGNLTLTLYPKEKLTTSISVEGNKYAGSTQTIKTTITNTGDEQQLSLYFWIKTDPKYFDNTSEKDLKEDGFAGITALKGATHVEVTPFTPASPGTYYIWVTKDEKGKEVVAQADFTVAANPHTVNGLAIKQFVPQGLQSTTVQTTGEIVQELFAASIMPEVFTIANASAADINNASVQFFIYKKEGETWKELQNWSLQKPVTLKPNESLKINGWKIAEGFGQYRLDMRCNNVVADSRYINTCESYTVIDANGKLIPTKYTSGTIVTPANATAMLMENLVNDKVTVTPNDNPNTLYYLGEGMTATGLDGKNIITYSQPSTVTLQDGYNFCVPYDFTAQTISYKRSFQAGWTTLVLPFDIATIPEGLTAYEFVSEDGSEVTFKQVSKLSAFEPCLLKVDAAKEYTFTGTNQKIWSNYTDAATALNFKFIGITSKPAYEQAYMLNADGTKFEKSTNPAYQSFRGCFVPTYGATNLPDALTVKGVTTGIKTVLASDAKTDDGYYNLAGQRVSAGFKGIVIHNGKKVVKR